MFFLDVQGTLISDSDKSLIQGAKELIDFLNIKQIPYVIITNNTKKLDFLDYLRQKGLKIKKDAYIDPFCVLNRILKPCKIAAFGSNEFLCSLEKLGFKFDFIYPKAVLVASYDDFKFKDFASMIEFAKKGIQFIVMHETSIYKKDNRLYPGVGGIMVMLKHAVNFKYEVIGKPSISFYQEALNLLKKQDLKANFKESKIISDDFKGDLLKAKELGMKTLLVLSGKISDTKGIDMNLLDRVYPSVFEFLKELKCQI
ncbi:HAD-IIA family hydrolase [Campylobacter hepaticus]|uniref:HAD-IIA family hydrolase n=1 Tax=Campylobacter hepaticus TaxID=1813019 RepID=A0A6A7JQG7_9BACT|nr:HAD-IIA family hydrolase [Campylobacter hepaticus]AXP09413.1 HAD-IIA family hydrolase [Campylobacter hepaticus]MCZ0772841.1 HAD-IIA family hydrolase [Campylobacter hepaticus]MCZ0774310.1 HAD-IIA family hydrolase [Campylobacter hepaticus]MCZ0775562.1 HAD-IIA family hydrolase [Campylobacter hepaticus]MDX2323155.1 HAD-IIA family hydrolase [Campylobacter hepaticus]